jgi:hypothetical protein
LMDLNCDLWICASARRRHCMVQPGSENGGGLPLSAINRCRVNHRRFDTCCQKQVQQSEWKPCRECRLNVGRYAHDQSQRKTLWPIPRPQRQAGEPNDRQRFPLHRWWPMCEWNLQITASNLIRRERNRDTSTSNVSLTLRCGSMLDLFVKKL